MNVPANRSAAGSAVASLQSLKQGLQNVQSTIVARGGDPFLRMGTDGVWVYGPENIEVEEGSVWAVNPFSIMHGWASWTDHPGKQKNELVGEVMVPMTSPLPPQHEMRDTGWDWAQQLSMVLVCIKGEDEGEQVLYKTTSIGGSTAVKGVIGDIMAQLDKDPGKPVPCLRLENSHYNHAKYGKTYTPVFAIDHWAALTDDLPTEIDSGEEEVAETPEPTPAPEPAKPTRTRRASVPATEKPAEAEPAAGTPEGHAEARRRALLAELAELSGAAPTTADNAPAAEPAATAAPGTTLRRRRG